MAGAAPEAARLRRWTRPGVAARQPTPAHPPHPPQLAAAVATWDDATAPDAASAWAAAAVPNVLYVCAGVHADIPGADAPPGPPLAGLPPGERLRDGVGGVGG